MNGSTEVNIIQLGQLCTLQSEQFKFGFSCLPVAQGAFCVHSMPKIPRVLEFRAKRPTKCLRQENVILTACSLYYSYPNREIQDNFRQKQFICMVEVIKHPGNFSSLQHLQGNPKPGINSVLRHFTPRP